MLLKKNFILSDWIIYTVKSWNFQIKAIHVTLYSVTYESVENLVSVTNQKKYQFFSIMQILHVKLPHTKRIYPLPHSKTTEYESKSWRN